MAYRFFLSYARADEGENAEVMEFVDYLKSEVAAAIGRDDGEKTAFIDGDIEPARDWSRDISEGLRTSKSLVCLMTPSYIDSVYCGREFAAFQQRLATAGALDQGLIIPVIWRPVKRELPTVLTKLQYDHPDLPRAYREEGLRQMKRVSRFHDDYHITVTRLAELIAGNTRASLLAEAESITSLPHTPNAFRPGDAVEGIGAVGPKSAKFVFLVPHPVELPPQKKDRGAYDDEGGYWWRAYQPPEEQPIGVVANSAAVEVHAMYDHMPATDDLADKLEIAAKNNTMIAVVVDPWALTLEKYDRLARAVRDKTQSSPAVRDACGVFVSWNNSDQETGAARAQLEEYVRAAFVGTRPLQYFFHLDTVADFRKQLVETLTAIKLRIVEKGRVGRPTQPGPPLHSLNVPGGSGS
jgi:FxsC-like protein